MFLNLFLSMCVIQDFVHVKHEGMKRRWGSILVSFCSLTFVSLCLHISFSLCQCCCCWSTWWVVTFLVAIGIDMEVILVSIVAHNNQCATSRGGTQNHNGKNNVGF